MPDPWSEEPHRSQRTLDQLSASLELHGFTTLRDHDLRRRYLPVL